MNLKPKPVPEAARHAGTPAIPGITVIDYNENIFEQTHPSDIAQCLLFKEKPTVTWIDFEGIPSLATIEKLGNCYGFHPLVLEDVADTDQRPKFEDYGSYLNLVLKMLTYDEKSNRIKSEQVSLILGENYIFSFQEGLEGDVFGRVRDRLKNAKGNIRRSGADYLVYSLLDAVVDNYFLILEKMGEKIEDLEELLVVHPDPTALKPLNDLKREMLFLRKNIWPLREVVNSLSRGDLALIKDSSKIYFRDVYNHVIQVIDAVETYRDMLSGMLDIYLSSFSNRLNEVMKVLTIIATIFMPLTFIAGIYGMNFKYMPELAWKSGYPLILFLMLVVAGWMLVYFKRKKWL